MKHILFPTDYSEAATNAFIYALKVAHKMNAKITTLHVNQIPILELERRGVDKDLKKLQEEIEIQEFDEYKNRIPQLKAIAKEHNLEDIPLQHIMEAGKVVPTIVKVADDNKVDLIIMGTKGAGFLKEMLFGSNAGEILENANCPVLAIPKKANFDGKIDKIAVTTGFLENEQKAILKALEFASWFKAKLYVVHVDVSYTHLFTNKMEEVKKEFEFYRKNMDFVVLRGSDLLGNLSQYLEANSFDLVAMPTHKKNFIQELFNYSKAKSMTYQFDVPVLSLPAHTL